MKVRLELGPVRIQATHDETLPSAFFKVGSQSLGNSLEVLQRLFRNAAFGMSAFIPTVAITRTVARQHVYDGSILPQVVESKIEETGALPINHGNAQCRLSPKQPCQRFQLKLRLKIDVCASQSQRQLVFPPEVLGRAGKNCPAARMTTEVDSQIENSVEIRVKRPVLAFRRGTFQRLLDNIFSHDCFATMRTILRRVGLKIK